MRICSLLPSATEIVFLLGLGDQLFGVSHECDYPPEARGKRVLVRSVVEPARLTSRQIDDMVAQHSASGQPLYLLDWEAFQDIGPDLVLTQSLCDVCAVPARQVGQAVSVLLRAPEVLSLDPHTLEDVLQDILRVGKATGTAARARSAIAALRRRIQAVERRTRDVTERPRVVCLEWLDPPIVAGHWVPEMVELAGGRDVLARPGSPSRRAAWDEVVEAQPEVLVLMPCGFDVARTLDEARLLSALPGWAQLPAVRGGRVWAANAHEYYSRPGPRLVDGLEFLAEMLHPEAFRGYIHPRAAAPVLVGGLSPT